MNRMQRKVKRSLFSFKTRPGIPGRTAPAHKGDDEQKAYVTITYLSRSQLTCMGVDNGSQNGISGARAICGRYNP